MKQVEVPPSVPGSRAFGDLLVAIAVALVPMFFVELVPVVWAVGLAAVLLMLGLGVVWRLSNPVLLVREDRQQGKHRWWARTISCGSAGRLVMRQRYRRHPTTVVIVDDGQKASVRAEAAVVAAALVELGYTVDDATVDHRFSPVIRGTYSLCGGAGVAHGLYLDPPALALTLAS